VLRQRLRLERKLGNGRASFELTFREVTSALDVDLRQERELREHGEPSGGARRPTDPTEGSKPRLEANSRLLQVTEDSTALLHTNQDHEW
jgi:hypothetical protein